MIKVSIYNITIILICLFQNKYNVVKYRLIGDSPVEDAFSFNADDGKIRLTKDLRTTDETRYRARVIAYDNGTPSLSANTVVNIIINRNLNRPVFQNSPYQVRIPENQIVGSVAVNLVVRDNDVQVGT